MAGRPNIICIIADDIGWRDVQCYGSSFYETPNIDRLAAEGTKFTNAYAAAPVCSPTRASIQTGRYPSRIGVTDWIDSSETTHPARGKLIDAPYADHLPHEEKTIASELADHGYHTWHVGKWHLGGRKQQSRPEDHGFAVNIGGCALGSPHQGYFGPWGIPTLTEKDNDEKRYLPNRLGEEVVNLIDRHAHNDDPFFLQFAPYLVHTPLEAPEQDIERYEEKRNQLGLTEKEVVKIGRHFPTEHKKDLRIKRRLVQSHPIYAAMVEALDRNVGRLLDALEQTGQANETVIIFTSDNGGLATAEGSPTTNLPLREGKGWMEEGGNRVPFIIRWPGVSDQETAPDTCEIPVSSQDVFPTLLAAAGRSLPDDRIIDGEDLRPALSGGKLSREALFWHYPHYGNQGGTPAGAIRVGDWKLIEFFENNRIELYNLRQDISERRDLSDERTDMASDLLKRLRTWRRSVGAREPAENPDYNPWACRAEPGSE